MKDDASQVSATQEVQPEVKEVTQTPQQPPANSLIPPPPAGGSTPPPKLKKRLILKISIILIILTTLGIGGFLAWKYFSTSKTSVPLLERIVKQKKEEEISIYKGIWMPVLLFRDQNYLASNIDKLKGMGINTIFIQASPPQSEQWLEKAKEDFPPELVERIAEILPSEKELIIDNIQTAHRNGLKVGLTVSNPPDMEGVDLEILNSEIVEYARLAEEYEVELFAPMNEPGKIFGKNIGKWRQEILAKIKKVYHGEVLWKGAGIGLPKEELTEEFLKELSENPPGDYSGYDYRGFSSMLLPEGQTIEEYSQNVDDVLKYVLVLAEKDGCKGVIISEFGVLGGGPWSEEEVARAYEMVLEKGKDEIVGFFAFAEYFLGLELPGMVIEENPKAQEVIKRYFTEILPEKKTVIY
jgi:hypothetical protein